MRPDDQPEYLEHLAELCGAIHSVPMQRSRGRNVRAVVKAGLTGQSAIILRDELADMQTLLRRLYLETRGDLTESVYLYGRQG